MMDFRFKTKEHVFTKVIADPTADESEWLPACHAVGDKELVKPVVEAKPTGALGKLGAFMMMCVTTMSIIAGQVCLVANAADFAGNISSLGLGQLYDRVMYHCGPQDTLLGAFIVVAFPLFWSAWCFP
ncbi:MAG: hypothetical protein K2X81_24125, partial [Candidatus Obscuribacterales bacterium]|nr:hypothetical protein [Candidatus Obscuribacterales bacterium]